jgi:hypothetical protein
LCRFISLWFPLGAYCQWGPGGCDLRVLILVTSLCVSLCKSRVLSLSGFLSVVIVSGARVALSLCTYPSDFFVCCMISRWFPLSWQCTYISDFFVGLSLCGSLSVLIVSGARVAAISVYLSQ